MHPGLALATSETENMKLFIRFDPLTVWHFQESHSGRDHARVWSGEKMEMKRCTTHGRRGGQMQLNRAAKREQKTSTSSEDLLH